MTDALSWDDLLNEAGDAVATSFEALPAGNYDLEVVDAQHTMTKTTPSKNMWKVQYKVVGGEYNNRRLFNNIVLSPENKQALGFFFRNMAAHGLGKEFFASKPNNEQITTALKNRRVRAQVTQRTYQGELQNEIKSYSPAAQAAMPQAATPPVPQAAPAPQGYAAPPAPAPAAPPAQDPWSGQPAAPAQQYVEPSPQAGAVPAPPQLPF